MEVAATNFRLATSESVDVPRDVDDDQPDTVQRRFSSVSFKKNILHRYCEYRMNAKTKYRALTYDSGLTYA